MSDHPHAPPLTPTHLKHLPLHTHKKCPPTTNYPKYTSIHPHPPEPTYRIRPSTPTHSRQECPTTLTHPKYTYTNTKISTFLH